MKARRLIKTVLRFTEELVHIQHKVKRLFISHTREVECSLYTKSDNSSDRSSIATSLFLRGGWFPTNRSSSFWQVEEDKWKVKMARGGVLVSRNGYCGTLPCRALWDMSSIGATAQMTYYSSAGNAWAYRRRRFCAVLQTFNFGRPPRCFYPGSARAPRRAEACLRWPLRRRMGAPRTP